MARTNIDLNDALVKRGLRLTRVKTKRELVNRALEELVKRETRKGILQLEGKIGWSGSLAQMRKGRFDPRRYQRLARLPGR